MDPHEEFVKSLSREEIHLLALRELLYDGSSEELIKDLEARREGRPFVFQLRVKIDEDLRKLRSLLDYEAKHKVNLGQYVTQGILAGEEKAT